jgi:hypothetical protein
MRKDLNSEAQLLNHIIWKIVHTMQLKYEPQNYMEINGHNMTNQHIRNHNYTTQQFL